MTLLEACMEMADREARAAIPPPPPDGEPVPLTTRDLREMAAWLTAPDAPAFPTAWLPETGLAVHDRGRLLAAITVYLDRSSPVAVAGWCAAHPGNSCRQSRQAVERLLADLPDYVRSLGARVLLTMYGCRSLNRLLSGQGFQCGESSETKFKIL